MPIFYIDNLKDYTYQLLLNNGYPLVSAGSSGRQYGPIYTNNEHIGF